MHTYLPAYKYLSSHLPTYRPTMQGHTHLNTYFQARITGIPFQTLLRPLVYIVSLAEGLFF